MCKFSLVPFWTIIKLKLTWCWLCEKPRSVLEVHHPRRQVPADQKSSLSLCPSSGSSSFSHRQRNYYSGSFLSFLKLNRQEDHLKGWWQTAESNGEISFSIHGDVWYQLKLLQVWLLGLLARLQWPILITTGSGFTWSACAVCWIPRRKNVV